MLSGHLHEWFASPFVKDKKPNHFTIGTGAQQLSKRSFAVLDVFDAVIRVRVFEFDEVRKQFIPSEKSVDFALDSCRPRPV